MTFDELLVLAKRRQGVIVEWTRSKKTEYIYKGHRGAKNICAKNVATGRVHPLYPKEHYHCREVLSHEMIALGQLL